jgi:hypothetical protein
MGDQHNSGHGDIEKATAQVCRGLNGFVEFLSTNKQIISQKTTAYLLPVIFATAKIWVSDVNLTLTNIENGKINLDNTKLEEKPWVFYQYHQSPGIKHTQYPAEHSEEIGKLLDLEYIRTIVIVSSLGIKDFLSWSSNTDNIFP